MAKKRDYKAEYQSRIARGLAKGMTRSQARGHPRAGEKPARTRPPPIESEPKLEEGFKLLRSGGTLVTASKTVDVSRERLRRYIKSNELAVWRGRRWVVTDSRPRKVPVLTKGRQRELVVPDLRQASVAGAYWHAAGQFVRTNNIRLLEPFRDRGVRDVKDRFFPFETDPNELHRLAALDAPTFHEIYQIVQK